MALDELGDALDRDLPVGGEAAEHLARERVDAQPGGDAEEVVLADQRGRVAPALPLLLRLRLLLGGRLAMQHEPADRGVADRALEVRDAGGRQRRGCGAGRGRGSLLGSGLAYALHGATLGACRRAV